MVCRRAPPWSKPAPCASNRFLSRPPPRRSAHGSYLSRAADLAGVWFLITALTPLVIPAICVVPRDDAATPRMQSKEMKTWFKIGRN